MKCLRCGRETTDQQIFCDSCLRMMEQYPVKPDMPVYIPVRKAPPVPKKQPRRTRKKRTPEERIVHLRKYVRGLWIFSAVMLLLLGLSLTAIAYLMADNPPKFDIGQNFQTAETTPTVSTTGE